MLFFRTSYQRCSMKKGVLRNFTIFTGKHLYQSLFLKKETLVHVFSCEFSEFSENTLFTEHLWPTASVSFLTGLPSKFIEDLKNMETDVNFQAMDLVCALIKIKKYDSNERYFNQLYQDLLTG